MNHNPFKSSVVSLLAVVLLYYSVAWSVLGCFHDDEDAFSEQTFAYAGLQLNEFLDLPWHHATTHLDCEGPNYHTEALAGTSFLPKLHLSDFGVASAANDPLTFYGSGT